MGSHPQETRLHNPVIPGFHPDPSCVFVDGIFYLVNSTFQWFPHISVNCSYDLVTWTACKSAINKPGVISIDKATTRGCHTEGILAPTIRYHKNKFYIVCTNILLTGKADTFFVTCENPIIGDWSDPIHIDFHGIDPSLFFDDDDKVYFQGTMFPEKPTDGKLPEGVLPQIVQMEIDINTGKSLSGPPRPLVNAFGGGWAEGPHVYKKDGWYYGLLAEDGTEINHCVTMCRARNIWGPFEHHPQNPVLTARKTDEYIQGIGHADLFQDSVGNWWAVALAVRLAADGHFPLGRETFLCPVTWPAMEWPIFNSWRSLRTEMILPHPLPVPDEKSHISPLPRIQEKLEPQNPRVLYLRDPDFSCYQWHEGEALSIIGTPSNLYAQTGTVSLVGFRQESLNSQFSVSLDFQPDSSHEEAGLAVYTDHLRHLSISLQGCDIVFSTSDLKSGTQVRKFPLNQNPDSKVSLRVRCSELFYAFDLRVDDKDEWKEIGTADSKKLSEWGYTGPIFALFVTSNGGSRTKPVKFENMSITENFHKST